MNTAKENVFDTGAEKYDGWYDSENGKPLYQSEVECLRPLVPETGGPILEIGVGTGRFAMHFPGAYGVDPAFSTLKIAQTRGVRCVRGRGETLPFRCRTFETVLVIATLCFVKEPVLLLKEAKRVLTGEGSIVVGFIPKDSPWGIFCEEKKRRGSPFYGGASFYTFPSLEYLLREAGLKASRIRSTLLREPSVPAKVEESHEGHVRGAGFVCVKVESQ